MQIAASVHKVYIGYVADPQLVCRGRHIPLYQILVLVEAMVGVCRVPWSWLGEGQTEIVHDAQEGIASRNPVALEHALEYQPQLVVADARIHLADFRNGIYNARQVSNILRIITLLLVVGLF